MIVRPKNGGWLLVTQPAHAWLAGELVAQWGNTEFARPSPRKAVLVATHLHDVGWQGWDAAPRLGANGQPVNFLDLTLAETAPMWPVAVRFVSLLDPFAGLLVSKHGETIYRRRLAREADPPAERERAEELLAEQQGLQSAIRARLADHSRYGSVVGGPGEQQAYRTLRINDLLSLLLCSANFSDSGTLERVPLDGRETFTTIQYDRPEPFHLCLDPWPFRVPIVQLTVQVRRLEQETYADQAAFHEALESAHWSDQAIRVEAAKG